MQRAPTPENGQFHFTGALEILDHVFAPSRRHNGALAVAAAGNDSDLEQSELHFGPRVPAAIEGVVAVAAYARDQHGNWEQEPVDYSNNDGLFPKNDGVGAFGGRLTKKERKSSRGLYGPYVSDTVPAYIQGTGAETPGAEPNETGWAMWSGTSFATAVASGFAACLWSEAPALWADEIFRHVVYDANGQERKFLPFYQTTRVRA